MSTDWHAQAIYDLQNTNLSYREIGEKYGRERDTIVKLRREQGIVRTKTPRSGPKREIERAQISRTHRSIGMKMTLYRGLRSYSEFAEELKVSRHIVKLMEIGAYDFTLEQLQTLSLILDEPIQELITPYAVQSNGR